MFGQGDVDCGQFLALGLDGGWISSLLMGPAIQGLSQPHNLDSLAQLIYNFSDHPVSAALANL